MDEQAAQPSGTRTAFDEIRRAVMARLREQGFRTTGGVARLLVDGNSGVIEVQKSGRSTAESQLFTINVGIALGALIARTSKKPISHCSVAECHAHLRLSQFRDPESDVWWTVAGTEIDQAVLSDITERLEADALPFIRQAVAKGALAARWRAGEGLGVPATRRAQYLKWLGAGAE